ncbi:Transposase [Rhizobiales bacterium GAS113]|nr:Transposase [Rhizobiales bacterium GAS113]
MKKSASWAPAPNLKVLAVERNETEWTVSVNGQDPATCPVCGIRSISRHSSYRRTLHDLPAQGTPVTVRARLTRWRCRNDQCERRIFAERLPRLAAPFARRTARLAEIVRLFGHGAGGRPAERLMARLGMPVGHTTILRDVKRSARTHADPALVRVAGIDDWAWRKGMTYGTVIVDLERRRVVDLLADRSAASTAKWLKGHPEVEVVSRDRAGLYAEAAREGAPQARQVADLFHLLRNFREAIERQLGRFEAPIREAPVPAVKDETGPELSVAQGPGGRSDTAEHRHFARRARRAARQALFDQIRALYDAGKTVTAIARELSLGRRRVDPWRRKHARPPTTKPSCRAAGPRGITAVRRLFDDIRQRGYTGSYSHLARFLAPWRNIARPLDGMSGRPPSPSNYDTPAPSPMLDPMTGRQISPQTAAALCVKPRGQMTPRQILNVDALKAASPEFATMRQLAMRFRGLLRGDSLEKLDVWLRDAHLSSIYAIRRFVRTLRQDIGAVRNAVLEPWSNGQTEGQINRLKTLKRAMYGRAGIELLRARMIPLHEGDLHRE